MRVRVCVCACVRVCVCACAVRVCVGVRISTRAPVCVANTGFTRQPNTCAVHTRLHSRGVHVRTDCMLEEGALRPSATEASTQQAHTFILVRVKLERQQVVGLANVIVRALGIKAQHLAARPSDGLTGGSLPAFPKTKKKPSAVAGTAEDTGRGADGERGEAERIRRGRGSGDEPGSSPLPLQTAAASLAAARPQPRRGPAHAVASQRAPAFIHLHIRRGANEHEPSESPLGT